MKKFLSFLVASLFLISIAGAQNPIPQYFHSGNGWMPPFVGDINSPGTLYHSTTHKHETGGKFYEIFGKTDLVQDLNFKMLRYNGILHDLNRPTAAQYKQFSDSCRANQIEPFIGIPFLNYFYLQRKIDSTVKLDTVIAWAKQPGGFIHQVLDDITSFQDTTTYITIMNEPDGWHDNFKAVVDSLVARDVFEIYDAFVPIIKSRIPNAKIIGPEIKSEGLWAYPQNFSNELLGGGANDITQLVDYYSFHLYPHPDCCGGTYNDSAMVAYPSTNFQGNLQLLRQKIADSKKSTVKLAITEINMVKKNESNNGVLDKSSNSHRAGQFIASMWGEAQKPSHNGLGPIEMFQVWSVHESGGNPNSPTDFSILNGDYSAGNIPKGRSTYWHLWMMKFLQDKFYSGT
ncbi:MAG: hypothetical protein H0X62_16865, partial [Bacteroidetes bacterium]|nr:hypothetical protein [Bacteroidota bacterium]